MESPWECPVLVFLPKKFSEQILLLHYINRILCLWLFFFFFQFFGSWKEQGSSVVISETLLLLGPDLE